MGKVKVIKENESGLNKKIEYEGKEYTNNQAYEKAKKGEMPGYVAVNNNGTKFIRSVPDGKEKNNIE